MSYLAVGVASVSVISSVMGQSAAAKQADRARTAEMSGARMNFASTENSVNIMKAANRESTIGALGEVARVGAEQNRRVKAEITTVTSTAVASSEGLTSGRSKGRQMVALQVKGNQAVQDSKSETSSMMNQIVEAQDKATNDLNNKLFTAHQQMATVLSTPGATYQGNVGETISAGIGGAAAGASLVSAFKL